MSRTNNLNQYGESLISTYQEVKNGVTTTKFAEIIGSILVASCVLNFFYSLDRVDLTETLLSGIAAVTLYKMCNVVCYIRNCHKNVQEIGIRGIEMKKNLNKMTDENIDRYLRALQGKKNLIAQWQKAYLDIKDLVKTALNQKIEDSSGVTTYKLRQVLEVHFKSWVDRQEETKNNVMMALGVLEWMQKKD